MKRIYLIMMILSGLLLACGTAVPDNASETPAGTADPALESAPDLLPRATLTAPPAAGQDGADPGTDAGADAGSYPGPAAAPTSSEAYPGPGPDAYPAAGATVWLVRPAGEQCATQDEYADLQAAVAGLIAVGVTVIKSETTELAVCTACGCPTSAHYRVEVAATDVANAELLGWAREQQE